MSKLKFSKGKFSRFISSKGFYVALAICLIGASAATWMAVDKTITGIEDQNSQILQQENPFVDFPQVEDVDQSTAGVPMETGDPEPVDKPAPEPQSDSQPSSSTSSSSPEESSAPRVQSVQSTAPEPSPTLAYTLPIRGDVIESFSDGELVKNITLGDWRTHDGMDIYAEQGAEICAAADGVVAEIRSDPLWGGVVVIDHSDGNQTHYCGLGAAISVSVGEAVTARQVIGKLDGIPCEISDQSHLHFAVRSGGSWINPMDVLSGTAQ